MLRFVKGETRILRPLRYRSGSGCPRSDDAHTECRTFRFVAIASVERQGGRGADQSYCVLLTSYKLSDEGRKRIEIMVSSNDGFEIAEADLKCGPGDSGRPAAKWGPSTENCRSGQRCPDIGICPPNRRGMPRERSGLIFARKCFDGRGVKKTLRQENKLGSYQLVMK